MPKDDETLNGKRRRRAAAPPAPPATSRPSTRAAPAARAAPDRATRTPVRHDHERRRQDDLARPTSRPARSDRMDVALHRRQVGQAARPIAALKNAVAGMVGLDPSRGDTITSRRVPFAKAGRRRAASAGLLGVPLSIRHRQVRRRRHRRAGLPLPRPQNLKRREGEARRARADVAARDHRHARRSPSSSRASPTAMPPELVAAAARPCSARPRRSSRKQPEHVAIQVQQWMSE